MSREPAYTPTFTKRDERIVCAFAPIVMRKAIQFGLRESMIKTTSIFFRHSGKAIALNYRNRSGLTGSCAKDVALPLYWGHSATSAGAIEDLDVHENGATAVVNHCPFGGLPEICQSVSYAMAEGICSEVNPDWCFTFSRFQSGTETSCRYFVSPKGVLESDLGRSIERIRVPEMTPEEIAELGRHCCCVISGRIAKAAIMAGGPKAVAIMRESSVEAAEVIRNIIEEDGGDIAKMTPVELFSVFASAFGWATSVSDENVLTVNECPFHDGPDEFCDAIENTISTLMARAGNGNIVRCQSRKSPGQKSCQYLIVALRKDSRQ